MSKEFFSVGARVLHMGYWRGVAQDPKAPAGMRKMAEDLIRYEERLRRVEWERDALAKRLSEAESVRETFLQVLVALASSKTRQEAATNLEALLGTIAP